MTVLFAPSAPHISAVTMEDCRVDGQTMPMTFFMALSYEYNVPGSIESNSTDRKHYNSSLMCVLYDSSESEYVQNKAQLIRI
jgi:hypothetical protein